VRTLARACPACCRPTAGAELRAHEGVGLAVLGLVAFNVPGWTPREGLCPDCARRFADAFALLRSRLAGFDGLGILPTPLRLGASDRRRGRGVTIAFLDSGFHAHPDLTEPADRILAHVDLTRPRPRPGPVPPPDESSWHGLMTSVVACGNGRLSGGLYRGLASEARLVLVKCGTARRIRHQDIERGLRWVVAHRERYGIRVANVSCGGDYEASYLEDGLSAAAEEAARAGVLVCAAVGNQGHHQRHPVLPPASAPSVLAVGGLDDKNRLAFGGFEMYHSSYGPTVDGLQKPEVIAPSIWVAAPILPGTPTAAQAALLERLEALPDARLAGAIRAESGVDADLEAAVDLAPPLLRELVRVKRRDGNVISGAYKHVDGTSFAAPIVSSLAAQMLEAHPGLRPMDLRRLVVATARRIPHVEADRQGFGVIDPAQAVAAAEEAAARAGATEKASGRLAAPRATS
jgi:serine protease AprX